MSHFYPLEKEMTHNKKGEVQRRKNTRLAIDPRVPKIFDKLRKTQRRLKFFSAQMTGHFESYGGTGDTVMDFTGRYDAFGSERGLITLAAVPIVRTGTGTNAKVEKYFPQVPVMEHNHLGAYNLINYFDYTVLQDNYNWDITYESDDAIDLRGYANRLSQQPYQLIININKQYWVPVSLQTYLDGQTVVNWANTTYAEVDGIQVLVRQVTTSIFKDRVMQIYNLDLRSQFGLG